MDTAMNMDDELSEFLAHLTRVSDNQPAWDNLKKEEYLDTIFGRLSLDFGEHESEGEYVIVGFMLPDGVYAEVGDRVYGQLQGFRIFGPSAEAD
jgi:hypothetical protein